MRSDGLTAITMNANAAAISEIATDYGEVEAFWRGCRGIIAGGVREYSHLFQQMSDKGTVGFLAKLVKRCSHCAASLRTMALRLTPNSPRVAVIRHKVNYNKSS
jgi:hypothetical protein